ncbi:MAG: tetratricopeptide repeat protein [Planctomycetes bacterium]|jgi:tetratricopeptide (TPR) repeat protein|nr:tetratricopeptide repeat protein [Planctomycetota bacterium]
MLRIQDRRIRIALAIVLLAVIGVALYQVGRNAWADWHYRRAREALDQFDYAQATAYLKRSLDLRGTDPETLLLAAQTARRQGSFAEANRLLAKAHKHGAPPEALDLEQRLLQIQSGDLSDAGGLIHLCQDRPDSPEALLPLEAIIEGSLKSKTPPLAFWGADLWLKHYPGALNQAQGYYWRARAHQDAGDFPRARADFLQALEAAPDHYLARLWLATFLVEKEPHEAAVHIDWLRQKRPNELAVRFQSARLQRNLGRPEDAAVLLDQILASAPENPAIVPALVERGRVEMDLNRPGEAEHWIRRALEITPWQREVNLALADCLLRAGRNDDAKKYQKIVQEIDVQNAKMKAEREKQTGK